MSAWETVNYIIATCPHCPPSEAQRRINLKSQNPSANGVQRAVLQRLGHGTLHYKLVRHKDDEGRDERVIEVCGLHAAHERLQRLRQGEAKTQEVFDDLLVAE